MKSERFQFLKQAMATPFASNALCGGDEAHKNYVNHFVKLCNYVSAVNNTALPALNYPFKNWDEYVKQFVSVKTQSLTWTTDVMGKLVNLPDTIIIKDKDMCNLFERIINTCAELVLHPDDARLKKRVSKDLNYCLDDLQDVCMRIDQVLKRLDEFHKSLEQQALKLQELADTSLQEEAVDRAKIEELKSTMEATKREIDYLTDSVIGLAVGAGICLAVAVGVGLAGPFGFIASIFVSIIAIADLAVLGTNSDELIKNKNKLDSLTKDMEFYTADAAALQLISQTFTDLVTMAGNVKESLQYIYDVWNAMSKDLDAIAAEIRKAAEDSATPLWKEVGADMQAGLDLWKQFAAKANILSLKEVKGNTARLELGMNPDEAKDALDKGQEVSLIKYLIA